MSEAGAASSAEAPPQLVVREEAGDPAAAQAVQGVVQCVGPEFLCDRFGFDRAQILVIAALLVLIVTTVFLISVFWRYYSSAIAAFVEKERREKEERERKEFERRRRTSEKDLSSKKED